MNTVLAMTPPQLHALESDLLRRWKMRICEAIRRADRATTERLGYERSMEWTRQAMESARIVGLTCYDDLERYAVLLFILSEVRRDQQAAADVAAIMLSAEDVSARMAMLEHAFPDEHMIRPL